MNRSTSDDIDPNPGPVAHRVIAAMWILNGVLISTHAVWIGIADILFGLAYVVTYEYKRWLKRKPRAIVDATPGPARSTGTSHGR